MNDLTDTITNLRAAISYARRSGNEAQSLANSKGHYRPVIEVLSPAVIALESVEQLIKDIQVGLTLDTPSMTQRLDVVKHALESFEASLQPNLSNANAMKASLAKGERYVK